MVVMVVVGVVGVMGSVDAGEENSLDMNRCLPPLYIPSSGVMSKRYSKCKKKARGSNNN
jgi:hypothetical protein